MGISFTNFLRLKKQDRNEKVSDHLSVINEDLDIIDSEIHQRAKTSDLSVVATTGSYNDLLNKPSFINGKEVEMNASSTHIQWRYVGDSNWINLIPLSQLIGEDGKSAYQVAISNGFSGTVGDWLQSLVGKSAYQEAVANGYTGTETEWLNSLKGESSYLYVRYSTELSGLNMTTNYIQGVTIYKGILITNSKTSPDITNPAKYTWALFEAKNGKDSINVFLTNQTAVLNADHNGNVANYSPAITSIEVYDGNARVAIENISITVTVDNITGSLSGLYYQVQSLTNDIGYVDFDVVYNSVVYRRRFSVSKNRNGADGENPLRLDIISTNGNIFKNGSISTTLIAKVYRGEAEVTSEFNENAFLWTRKSVDTAADTTWNQIHFSGTKTITITQNDVNKRATFFCDLIDTNTGDSLLGSGG